MDQNVIDVPPDDPRLPLDRVPVPLRRRTRKIGTGGRRFVGTAFPPMNRMEDRLRGLGDVLHDVDFAAIRPTPVGRVCRHEPERGPRAFRERQLHARLETSVRLRKFSTCGHEPADPGTV